MPVKPRSTVRKLDNWRFDCLVWWSYSAPTQHRSHSVEDTTEGNLNGY